MSRSEDTGALAARLLASGRTRAAEELLGLPRGSLGAPAQRPANGGFDAARAAAELQSRNPELASKFGIQPPPMKRGLVGRQYFLGPPQPQLSGFGLGRINQ